MNTDMATSDVSQKVDLRHKFEHLLPRVLKNDDLFEFYGNSGGYYYYYHMTTCIKNKQGKWVNQAHNAGNNNKNHRKAYLCQYRHPQASVSVIFRILFKSEFFIFVFSFSSF